MTTLKHSRASVALISLLMVMALAVILVVGMSETTISTSYQYVNNQSNTVSYYVGEACLDETLIRLENDPTFTGTTIVFDSNTQCVITVSGTGPLTIDVTVTDYTYTQNFEGQALMSQVGQANNIQLISWQEI